MWFRVLSKKKEVQRKKYKDNIITSQSSYYSL